MTQQQLDLLNTLLRIVGTIVVVSRAKSRGRSAWGWGLFAFFLPWPALISIWFVPRKKTAESVIPPSKQSQPLQTLPTSPVLVRTGPRSIHLSDVDRGNHKLSIQKIDGAATGRTVLLVSVVMPFKEYTDMLLQLGSGQITQERAAINILVRSVFPSSENDRRIFNSELEYTAFMQENCPGFASDASNNWFKVAAFAFVASLPGREQELLHFIEQQSTAYSTKRFSGLLAEAQVKKMDWASFQQLLKDHDITRLYHFTDRANIASIRNSGGLLSWYSCQQNGVSIPRPGGSDLSWQLDSSKGLADYVRLSFVSDHPMMHVARQDGRISSPVLLEIDPEIIFLQETKFTLMNAAKSGVNAAETFEKFSALKFSLFRKKYFDLSIEDKSFYQAEVLVHKMLPAKYILNLDRVPA